MEALPVQDQKIIESGDVEKIEERLNFWKNALAGKELKKNGEKYSEKTVKPYVNAIQKKLNELKAEEKKEEEKKKEESKVPKKLDITVNLIDGEE